MGTPSFVVPVLDGLFAAENVQVVGVYTPPDRPRGRGRSPEMPPVKARAIELELDVYQPESLRSQEVQAELNSLKADVFVVAAYGKLLPPPVLETPSHGCLNLHPSLLPKHRGPSPVATTIAPKPHSRSVMFCKLGNVSALCHANISSQRHKPLAIWSPELHAFIILRLH